MKKVLLGIVCCLSLGVYAQTYNFTTCGATGTFGPNQAGVDAAYAATNLNGLVTVSGQGIQEWVVPFTGNYQIQAAGASGGNSTWSSVVLGGNGSDMTGEFNLTAGQVVRILVGQAGETDAVGGGGGASFVSILGVPQIVGGAGGGASSDQAGVSSVATQDGTMDGLNLFAGGTSGNGGTACMSANGNNGGAGGGFLTDGASPNSGGGSETNGYGGFSFLNGGDGGEPGTDNGVCSFDPYGGFGGGGSSSCNTVGGGGGGGYSGGAGGTMVSQCGAGSRAGGGGGGSYNAGTNPVNLAGTNTGDGFVIITVLCSPTSITADAPNLADVNDECSSTPVTPTATNDCGASISGVPDVTLPITAQGTTVVTWTYDDGAGNVTTQQQNVILIDTITPLADSTSLPDLLDICGATSLVAPTATDLCVGQVTGTTTTTFPITTPGTSVITWTFDDGQGNISTQTQNIVNPTIDNGVTQVGTQLTSDAVSASYQWLDCDNAYAVIAGETNASFTPTATVGNYAVEITQGGCIDTSACFVIDYTGIDEMDLQGLNIYPNPTTGVFNVTSSSNITSIEVFDVLGRQVSLPIDLENGTVNGTKLENGNYIVTVETENGIFTKEIVILN